VAQRVLDQVDDQAVKLVARAVHRRAVDVEDYLVLGADGSQLARGLDGDLAEVAGLALDLARRVGAREEQQVRHQPAHALGGAQR
jgi:hypothetical protein